VCMHICVLGHTARNVRRVAGSKWRCRVARNDSKPRDVNARIDCHTRGDLLTGGGSGGERVKRESREKVKYRQWRSRQQQAEDLVHTSSWISLPAAVSSRSEAIRIQSCSAQPTNPPQIFRSYSAHRAEREASFRRLVPTPRNRIANR
jgi:hypothetical protein